MTLRIGGNRTIVDLFADNVRTVSEKPFVRFSGVEYTYGDIGRASEQLAGLLGQVGIGCQDCVALSITNRSAFLIAFLAILRRSATVVPLNTLYKPDEARYALDHAGCQAVVTEESLAPVVNEAREQADHEVACFVAGSEDENSFAFVPGRRPPARRNTSPKKPKPSDIAGIFYTSGTTARPKGVMITHENMVYSAEVTVRSLGLGENDIPALAFPLFHVNSLFYGVLTAILLRGTVGLLRGLSVSQYWKGVVEVGATWTPGITGSIIRLLLRQDKSDLETRHTMRFAVGGAFITLSEVQEFTNRFGVRLLPGWSMTETVSLGTLHPTVRLMPIPTISAIGFPTLGQEIRLIRSDGSDAAVGEPGEILYRSPSLFAGYLNDVQATREAFTEDGWFRTGDVAQMDENGYLSFVDRKKEMIKTKGENVAAAEVERVLNHHVAVLESAVIGVPDDEGLWGERIEAYVVRQAECDVESEELMAWASRQLADFKVPHAIHFVDALPKTPLGKIRRQQLRRVRVNQVDALGK